MAPAPRLWTGRVGMTSAACGRNGSRGRARPWKPTTWTPCWSGNRRTSATSPRCGPGPGRQGQHPERGAADRGPAAGAAVLRGGGRSRSLHALAGCRARSAGHGKAEPSRASSRTSSRRSWPGAGRPTAPSGWTRSASPDPGPGGRAARHPGDRWRPRPAAGPDDQTPGGTGDRGGVMRDRGQRHPAGDRGNQGGQAGMRGGRRRAADALLPWRRDAACDDAVRRVRRAHGPAAPLQPPTRSSETGTWCSSTSAPCGTGTSPTSAGPRYVGKQAARPRKEI